MRIPEEKKIEGEGEQPRTLDRRHHHLHPLSPILEISLFLGAGEYD